MFTHPKLGFAMITWFRKGVDPANIITLEQPVPSQWQIVKKLNEDDFQLTEAEHHHGYHPSFAAANLLVATLRITQSMPSCESTFKSLILGLR